jgi:two-component system, OmpR family, sensor histidine kinase KdpD
MNNLPVRPDPDVLLRRMQAEEARARRGRLRVFFGFAPGVGKTYRMLQVARELARQGIDVVIGVVEDHRRAQTASLVEGFERIAKQQVSYRGHTLDEFDIDAALARKPRLILIDELAHTNAPGSRHAKRWQDVEELLDAGIDVFSTMNVQHVESLNDVIAQITHVQVRETVPDSVIDGADAVELIDIAPEELIQRLKDGKVYLPDQARRAADHFFQRGNLLALRELALRRTAQHVDDEVLEYREQHGLQSTWAVGERVLVCVGPAPTSGRLIRAAARMASGLRSPWVAAYIDATTVRPLTDGDRERLDAHMRLAESLGATVTRLTGATVAEALLAYARRQNVTRIVIGKPTHSRLLDRLRGSLLDEVVRGSGDIEIHAISGDTGRHGSEDGEGRDARRARGDESAPSPQSAPALHYAASVGVVAATVAVALGLRGVLNPPDLEMPFLLAVMLAAFWFGRGPSILAAALGVASYDFFFVPPFYTFSVEDRRYVLTFAMMFAVGYIVSALTGRMRRQEQDAVAREERTTALYTLTRELAATDEPAQIAGVAARQAARVFGSEVVVLVAVADAVAEGGLAALGAAPATATLDDRDRGVAKWCHEHDELAGLGTDTLPGARILCAPLRVGQSRLGVVALAPRENRRPDIEQRAFLDVYCRQVAAALERARLADEARQAALKARTEEMRSSLLSAVSHDLRTPLASITGAATALRDDPALSGETRAELVDAVIDQAERLERLVANLLDMTRLESGAIVLRRDWVPVDEVVGSALTQLEARLGAREIRVSMAPDLPLVLVDPVLLEQVFVNLFENAEKYTPAAAPIDVRAASEGDSVVIEVSDRGPGLPSGSESRVFEKFYRGQHVGVAGAGLGLPICKGIVDAHGGTIAAENRPGGGTTFRIRLPLGGSPPVLELEGGAAGGAA